MEILEIEQILNMLPHKHPYLLVDRIFIHEPGKRIVGTKAVTYTEEIFRGHFPAKPIMPGAMIIEAASQVAGFLADLQKGVMGYVVEIKNFRFRKHVKPGTLLEIEATHSLSKGPFLLAKIKASVEGGVVAEGELQLFLEQKKADD